jgi:CheY-like chemotaxis protein
MTKPFSTLLVDDDADTRNIFKMVMEHYQLPLKITANADEALDYLKSHTPEVIVLDIFLPGLDGYQILNRIRKESLAPAAKMVATTAYHTADTPQAVTSRGVHGYLPKPLNSLTLVSYLEQLLGT